MQLKNNLFLLVVFMVIGCEKKLNNQEDSRVDTLPFFNEASFTPKWIAPKSKELNYFHKILDFELINQNSEAVTHQTFKNKI